VGIKQYAQIATCSARQNCAMSSGSAGSLPHRRMSLVCDFPVGDMVGHARSYHTCQSSQWWETNPATTPRQELCIVSPQLFLSPELFHRTGERQGFLLTFRRDGWYTETLSGSATCPTCATGSRAPGRAAAKLVRRHGTRRSLSPYRRTRPVRPGRTT
jgi:hypothetical protein